jgi:hypothetical protein
VGSEMCIRDRIYLVHVVDGLVRQQAKADAEFFSRICGRELSKIERQQLHACVLQAYRWQYIVAGLQDIHFNQILGRMITVEHAAKISQALANLEIPILPDVN